MEQRTITSTHIYVCHKVYHIYICHFFSFVDTYVLTMFPTKTKTFKGWNVYTILIKMNFIIVCAARLSTRNGHTKNQFIARLRGLHTTDMNIRMKYSRRGASKSLVTQAPFLFFDVFLNNNFPNIDNGAWVTK